MLAGERQSPLRKIKQLGGILGTFAMNSEELDVVDVSRRDVRIRSLNECL